MWRSKTSCGTNVRKLTFLHGLLRASMKPFPGRTRAIAVDMPGRERGKWSCMPPHNGQVENLERNKQTGLGIQRGPLRIEPGKPEQSSHYTPYFIATTRGRKKGPTDRVECQKRHPIERGPRPWPQLVSSLALRHRWRYRCDSPLG